MLTSPRCLALSLVLLGACAGDDGGAAGPTAPSNLTATPLGAGAHLTWKDNSMDESEFVIMRMRMGSDTALAELGRVPFNGTAFHDEPIVAGATYMYMVVATNANGESDSNQATFVAP
ncbi:MAG: fibronectin type III domain-containing protein [Deltaproteobacteria bacterium]|nr:fibronectin type III domain-containing protein [Deltaproteobacteria bacterium]